LGRGCQFKCRFCSYPLIGKKPGTYIRDYNLIEEEILRNYDDYGTTKYYFLDDTVNESETKVQALADIAQSLPFRLEWVGYNRLDLIWSKPSMIQTLKDSGLRSAYFGIESFHPKASMAVGKGWNGKHGKDFLLKLKEKWGTDISYYLSFIVGLPGEDKNSIEETHKWCVDNEVYDWNFHPLTIFEYKMWKSEFELNYEKYGYSRLSSTSWKNDLWTQGQAYRYAQELTRRRIDSYATYPTTWYLAFLSSLGYSFDELMKTKMSDLNITEQNERRDLMVRNYVTHQLK
ncbi:MAG TPA: radical SAM protein, partial [Ignavibacteriaceae bacterium]